MEEKHSKESMLSPYRVLDLTDEKGLLCGKLLGDLGADVIKIEKPGGDLTRNIGPFYHDEPDPEKSLFWFAFNTSKRGITLNIETADGQGIFNKLVKSADFVIESFPPEYMDKIGLGYPVLEKINPQVIMVSITPFGQTGPHKDYKAPDIVAMAMGGYMYPWGDPDRPPVRITHHSHAYLHAATDAASAAVMALLYRNITGEGQYVDVSIQDSMAQVTYGPTAMWDNRKIFNKRGEAAAAYGRMKRSWPCQDALVLFNFGTGLFARANRGLVKWMDDEGEADDFLRNADWDTLLDPQKVTPETIARIEEPVGKFFMSHTIDEILKAASKYRFTCSAYFTTAEIMKSPQLADRKFWVDIEHPELGTSITYPGAFTQATEAPPKISRRAPLIGEHNEEIHKKELGLSSEELVTLKQAKAI